MKITKGFRFWLGAAALVTLAACGGGGGPDDAGGGSPPPAPPPPTSPPTNPPTNPPTPADPQVRQTIGAAGGEIAFADQRFKLTIPPGALGNDVEIVITELSVANVPANLQPLNADKVYRLEPSGTQFAAPVTVTAQLPASDEIASLTHESNGTFGDLASHRLTLAASGRTLSGQITHFSNVAVTRHTDTTLRIDVAPKVLQPGQTLTAGVRIALAHPEKGTTLFVSRFDSVNVDVAIVELPPLGFAPPLTTLTGSLQGRCKAPGAGSVTYETRIYVPDPDTFRLKPQLDVAIVDKFDCVSPAPGNIVATGVFSAGVTNPDDVRIVTGPFANLPGTGPFAVVAGAEGAIVIDLVARRSAADYTINGPERDVLGSPLIGVLPVTRPGANAPAALFGFGTTGNSTVRTALRNYDPANTTFGFTSVGFNPTFDAITVGGATVADAFLSTGPGGIQPYRFDAANGYQPVPGGAISATRFAGGQLVSAAQTAEGGAILAATRGHDGNTTSRIWAHPGTGAAAATPIATLPAEARRIRCTNVRANADFCAVTLASGATSLFVGDRTNQFAPVSPLTVPTGNGSLGVAVGVRSNGNPYAVVANPDADTLTVIETTPDLVPVSNTAIRAAAGCSGPAHVGLVTDGEGEKAVVTCNRNGGMWAQRVFP